MFPELFDLLQLRGKLSKHVRVEELCTVSSESGTYPILAFEMGSSDPHAPSLGIVGGIHGLERIGTVVTLEFIRYLNSRLDWDEALLYELSKIRLFFVPLVNPVGMDQMSRCNGNDVDLMRNAPLESSEASFLVGGHRYSKRLPWYRGNPSMTTEGMEPELKALEAYIERQTHASSCSIILDLHSGFGLVDQLWFPYAKTRTPFPALAETYALKLLLDRTLSHHIYRFEPQAKHYQTHGDLWDYLFEKRMQKGTNGQLFLPLTLEMGSWNWIKKNPIQLFTFSGPFNPIKPHRQKRTMRRHLPLFDFLSRAVLSYSTWAQPDEEEKKYLWARAIQEWYSV